MEHKTFMMRMQAKDIRNHFQNADPEAYGHGVTSVDLSKAFKAADDLYEALHDIEDKLEGRES